MIAARDGALQRPNALGEFRRIKKSSVNKELRQFRALLCKAIEWEVLDKHPWRPGAVEQFNESDSKPALFYSVDELQDISRSATCS